MEEDDGDQDAGRMDEDAGDWDQALRRLASTMPPDLRYEVDDLLRLYAQNGVADAAADTAPFSATAASALFRAASSARRTRPAWIRAVRSRSSFLRAAAAAWLFSKAVFALARAASRKVSSRLACPLALTGVRA